MSLPQRIEDFIAKMAVCSNFGAMQSVMRDYITALGLEKFAYWLVLPPSGPRQVLCLTNYAAAWQSHYRNEGYASFDLIGRYAAKSVVPFFWKQVSVQPDLTKKQMQIFEEAAETGLASGCSIPVYGPGNGKAVFSVAGEEDGDMFRRNVTAHKHELQLMANYAHEKIMHIYRPLHVSVAPALTTREIEILTWIARGKSRWEAGVILGISEDTVRVHLEKTRHKLGASNTVHAISMAIRHGLLRD